MEGMEVKLNTFLTLVLGGSEWSAVLLNENSPWDNALKWTLTAFFIYCYLSTIK
jgi:hypothetical protein